MWSVHFLETERFLMIGPWAGRSNRKEAEEIRSRGAEESSLQRVDEFVL